jgi:nitrite reductase (NADH) large subunit
MDAQPRLVVVGNGMVGQRFLEALDPAAGFRITVLAEEPRAAYDRVQLSTSFSGRSAQDLSLAPAGFFESAHIALRLGERATAIDRRARCVHTHQHGEYVYPARIAGGDIWVQTTSRTAGPGSAPRATA